MNTDLPALSFAQIDDLRVAYRIFLNGQRPWIIILHGWNEYGMESWLSTATALADQYNVIAIDLPAFGKSQNPHTVWNTANYTVFVQKFINYIAEIYQFENKKLNVVAHSFGGSIACLLASKIPLYSLVLIAPAIYRAKPSIFKSAIINFSKSVSALLRPVSDYRIYQKVQKLWQKLVGGSDYSKTSGIKSEIFKVVVKDTVDPDTLSRISTKTLLVWGDKDMYTPFIYAHKLQSEIPNSTLICYPNINHGVHIHNQNQLLQDIYKFYSSLGK